MCFVIVLLRVAYYLYIHFVHILSKQDPCILFTYLFQNLYLSHRHQSNGHSDTRQEIQQSAVALHVTVTKHGIKFIVIETLSNVHVHHFHIIKGTI
jgi:hypothetical protein